jgi:hypothetical protein
MNYINTETGEDDLTEAQVRARFENVTFAPSDFPPAPYAELSKAAPPPFNPSAQEAARAPSVVLNGKWTQAWSIVDLPADVAAAKLAEHQAFQWDSIKAKRDSLKTDGGYKVAVSGVDKWFHSDVFSRTQQIGLVMLGASIPAGLQWKTMDASFVTMTQSLAAQVFQAAAGQDVAVFAAAETHRAAMLASANPMAYSFSGGWPATFPG